MVRLIGFEDLVQIIEGLGRIKALFLQVILTHDQAAVIEGLVEQLRHKIALAVLQRQFLHIILQAQLIDLKLQFFPKLALAKDIPSDFHSMIL